MKRALRWSAFAVVLAVFLNGCASSGGQYTPPIRQAVTTDRTIAMPFGQFWDVYVEQLSKSFFVINNIEKESRIVNVSFATNQPGDYVDCGRMLRTSSHPASGERTWRYDTADNSTYAAGVKGTNVEIQFARETSLDGRANIFMAPEADGTKLSVNARYVWTVKVTGHNPYAAAYGTGGYVGTESMSVTFTSTQAGSQTVNQETLTCLSKGRLEQQLLDLVAE